MHKLKELYGFKYMKGKSATAVNREGGRALGCKCEESAATISL
jgi:hypothetical protein